MKTEMLEELIRRYPKLADLVEGSHTDDGRWAEYHCCEGVFPPPPELGTMQAYSWYDDSCWAKVWDEQWFDAILADGAVVGNFVAMEETVAAALDRLRLSPVLIVRRAHAGTPNGPAWEGYTDSYQAWVYQMTD